MGKYIKKEFREIDLCPFFNEFFFGLNFFKSSGSHCATARYPIRELCFVCFSISDLWDFLMLMLAYFKICGVNFFYIYTQMKYYILYYNPDKIPPKNSTIIILYTYTTPI